MKIKSILLALTVVAAFASCVNNEEIPSQTAPSTTFKNKTLTIANTGETKLVDLVVNCDWTVSTDDERVKLSPLSGTSATRTLTVTVDEENTTDESIISKVLLHNSLDATQVDTLTVIQKGNNAFDGHITNAEDMLAFLDVAASLSDAEVIDLDADIDLGGAEIKPIVTFTATLDGHGHSIYNFTVASEFTGSGLIITNNGTVKNLKVGTKNGKAWDGVTKISFADGVASATAAGIVAVNCGTIQGVSNYASIVFNASTPSDALSGVGGIAGIYGDNKASIKDCHNYGTVSFTGVMKYASCLGGILGFSSQAGTSVENCTNNAALVQAVVNAKEFAIGGIVGRTGEALNVIGCTNNAPVSYESTDKPGSYLHIAGILGAAYKGCKVSDCKNKGDISSCINQVNRMGGIVGTMNSSGLIENCTNDGSVTVDQPTNANWQAVGGILGFEEKGTAAAMNKVSGSTNNGAVTLKLDNTTTHANCAAAGGIVGTTCSFVEYSGNTNNGKVSAFNTGSTPVYLGGITGWYLKGSAYVSHDNVNNAEVSNAAAAGAAGGVIGNASVESCSVKNETNYGSVTGGASTSGSIAGLAISSLNSCAVGGAVNGVEVSADNFSGLIQGSASKGTPVSCYFVGGSGPAAYVTATPSTMELAATGGAKDIIVNANCGWTAVSSDSWLTLSAAEGDGDGSITVSALENMAVTPRSATVTITCKTDATLVSTVSVTQAEHTDGLADNKITSAADFKTFVAIAPTLSSDTVIEMAADVDLEGAAITPIASFSATLDGKNHTLSNFTVTSSETTAGLFLVNNGTIKNLKVGTRNGTAWDNTTVISFADAVTGATAAGLVAENNAVMENVINYASIHFNAPSAASASGLGGLCGIFGSQNSHMKNCHNYGKVSLTGKMGATVGVGGLLGYTNANAAKATIEDCGNYTKITQSTVNAKELVLGGIVGRTGASLNVINCTNTANVSYTSTEKPGGYLHIAGIVGAAYYNCQITGCNNTGNISSCINQVNRAGGIVGTMNTGGLIDNCVNDGSVTVDQPTNTNWQAAGGILGFEEKGNATTMNKVSGCTNNGAVTLKLDNTTTHANCAAAGGIVGTTCSFVEYSGNTNNGKVSASNTGSTPVYLGGITGWYFKGTAYVSHDNINNAEVSNAAAGAAGGVIGNASIASCSVKDETNKGSVTGGASDSGSIAGLAVCSIESCKVGGSVNGTTVTASNFSSLIQGSASKGTPSSCTFSN